MLFFVESDISILSLVYMQCVGKNKWTLSLFLSTDEITPGYRLSC